MEPYQLFIFNLQTELSLIEDRLELKFTEVYRGGNYHHNDNSTDTRVSVFKSKVKAASRSALRKTLAALSAEIGFDYCILDKQQSALEAKLVVFDMDSTLIPIEVIDQLGEQANVKPQISQITEAAMRGELDFNQSLEQRVALLKGLPLKAIEQVKQQLSFNPGVETLCRTIIEQAGELCIASGGFMPFALHLSEQIPFSEINANNLIDNGTELTGQVTLPIVNAQVKAESLDKWRQNRRLSPIQTVAIGDGANDLLMLQEAGLGVAYKAKPAVNEQADCVLRFGEMDSLLALFAVISSSN